MDFKCTEDALECIKLETAELEEAVKAANQNILKKNSEIYCFHALILQGIWVRFRTSN